MVLFQKILTILVTLIINGFREKSVTHLVRVSPIVKSACLISNDDGDYETFHFCWIILNTGLKDWVYVCRAHQQTVKMVSYLFFQQ